MEKKRSRGTKALSVVLAAAMVSPMFFTGCAETSRINTDPEGGKILINGMYIGEGPTIFKYRAGLPESYIVDIRKDGYKPVTNATIDRTLRADESLLLLVLAIVPYFFSARLEDQYIFKMEPDLGTKPPASPSASATPPAPTNPLK